MNVRIWEEAIILWIGLMIFVLREKTLRVDYGTFFDWLKPKLFGLIILGLIFVPTYNLLEDQTILQDPVWVNLILLLIAVFLVYYLTAPLFILAYRAIRLSPLEFFDDFINSKEGRYVPRAIKWRTTPEMQNKVRELWTARNSAEYVRHQGCQFLTGGVQWMRMHILKVLLTTFPIMTISFAVISLTGQRFSAWQIAMGSKSDGGTVVLRSLLEHLYFCASVFSTLGIGDTRPVIDERGFGEAFVIAMLMVFMVTGLIILSLVISFIHSLFPAMEAAVNNAIYDASIDFPRPAPVLCPIEPSISLMIQRIVEFNENRGEKKKDKHR
jgi:hypothetical protein